MLTNNGISFFDSIHIQSQILIICHRFLIALTHKHINQVWHFLQRVHSFSTSIFLVSKKKRRKSVQHKVNGDRSEMGRWKMYSFDTKEYILTDQFMWKSSFSIFFSTCDYAPGSRQTQWEMSTKMWLNKAKRN